MEMEQAPPNHIKDQIKETQGTNTQRERERERERESVQICSSSKLIEKGF